MGVQGTGGVGGGVSRQRPSHVAYYVALAAILGLLALLLLYFFYFFINKIRKFNSQECVAEPSSSRRPPTSAPAYPVQPVVREGASEMAKLCKQLPPPGKGGTVFPTSTSPAAVRTDTGEAPADPVTTGPVAPPVPSAPPAPPSIEPAFKSVPAAVPSVIVESINAQ